MQVAVNSEIKPPYVMFENRSVEDRSGAITGKPQFKDVAFAIITPAGSRDRIEKIAEEWLTQIRNQPEDRFPSAWARHYHQAFEAWKTGQEIPVDGTALRNWPVLTPAQVKNLTGLNVLTVEQLAQANEETIHRMGMGARDLVQKARDFLSAASGPSKLVGEMSALRVKLEQEQQSNQVLRESLAALEAQVRSLSSMVASVQVAGVPQSSAGISSADLLSD